MHTYTSYTYSWQQWLAFFYIYCFLGWIFESTYVSLKKHRFVNRGFLRLPLLPLYGSGAIMMLWVSLPVQDNLFLVYVSGFFAATILEYATGFIMERLFKMRYWDYSDQPFQLHGYICLSSSLAWGGLTILMTEVIHHPIAQAVTATSPFILNPVLAVTTALFAVDIFESTKEALALGKTLETLTKLREESEEMRARILALRKEVETHAASIRQDVLDQLSELRQESEQFLRSAQSEVSERFTTARTETTERLSLAHTEISGHLASFHSETISRIHQLTLQLEDLKARKRALQPASSLNRFYRRHLLRGNPSAASRFSAALKELQEQEEKRRLHK